MNLRLFVLANSRKKKLTETNIPWHDICYREQIKNAGTNKKKTKEKNSKKK